MTTGSSLNILTWQQLQGTESLYTMMPAVKDYFLRRRFSRICYLMTPMRCFSRGKYWFYNLHDGKMLYLLCQLLLWNCNTQPLSCMHMSKGEGVTGIDNHVCWILNPVEHVELCSKSAEKWKDRRDHARISGKKYNYRFIVIGQIGKIRGVHTLECHLIYYPEIGFNLTLFI